MKKRYPLLLFSLIGTYYIYKNYFNTNKISNDKINNDKINNDKIRNDKINNDKINNKLNEKEIKPLTPIKKLARKGGIVETVLNLEMIAEPDLDPGIGLRIEEKENESNLPESEVKISEEKKVTFDLKLEIDETNYSEDSEEDENLCIL